MQIFLTGFMGCGKSYWGLRLSQWLSYPFFDLDDWIVDQEACSIAEIFDRQGEAGFRTLEKEYLQYLVNHEPKFIMATGGGTPCFHNNMEFMNQQGITLYLHATPGYLFRRLSADPTIRPLLDPADSIRLLDSINGLLSQREPFYQRAKFQLDVESANQNTFISLLKPYV